MFGGRGTTSILAVRDAPGTKASRTRKIRKRERCNLYRVGSVPKRPCRCFSGVVYFSRQGFVAPRTRPRASAVPHCLKPSKARQRRAGHRLTRQSASPLRTHPAEARTPTQRLRPDFTPGSGTPRPDPLRQDGQRWLLLLGRTHRNYSNQLPRPPPSPACPGLPGSFHGNHRKIRGHAAPATSWPTSGLPSVAPTARRVPLFWKLRVTNCPFNGSHLWTRGLAILQ